MRVLLVAAAAIGPLLPAALQAAEAKDVHMLVFSPGGNDYASHRNGVVLGQTEGNIQGRFLGIEYHLEEAGFARLGEASDDVSAVFVAGNRQQLLDVHAHYAPMGIPVFNIALEDMPLREQCYDNLYHTPPSQRMLLDAEAQWRQANPGATVRAAAWHPDFVKFAARDLNKRYMEQFGVAMDSAAWAGWAASRMVAEAVVRTGSAGAAAINTYLREDLGFDGQKGVAQTFRDNGQMRQPLLLLDGKGELLGEAPVRGVADSNDLDSMGLPGCQ